MKEEFVEYLKSIGMSQTLIDLSKDAFNIQSSLHNMEFQDLFVSEYYDEERRIYEAINFMSEGFVCGIWFIPKFEKLDSGRINDLTGMQCIFKNYNFQSATETSSLEWMFYYISTNMGSRFRASGKNCDHLNMIVKKYFMPYIRGKVR